MKRLWLKRNIKEHKIKYTMFFSHFLKGETPHGPMDYELIFLSRLLLIHLNFDTNTIEISWNWSTAMASYLRTMGMGIYSIFHLCSAVIFIHNVYSCEVMVQVLNLNILYIHGLVEVCTPHLNTSKSRSHKNNWSVPLDTVLIGTLSSAMQLTIN